MTELESKIREYKEYARIIEEAQAIRDAIGDELKAMMAAEGVDKLIVGEYKLSYVDVTRTTLNRARLEEKFGDLTEYTNTSTYKRFSVA